MQCPCPFPTQGSRVTYGELPGNPLTWDATMVRGCLCDGYPQYDKVTATGDVGMFVDHACRKSTCVVTVLLHCFPYSVPRIL